MSWKSVDGTVFFGAITIYRALFHDGAMTGNTGTGKTMEVPSSDTATTLGAALLAGVGVGMYESFEEAVEKTVNKGRVHTPNVEHKEIHEKNYETYRALYEQLKSLMKKTGGKKQ